jgi:hypothetical protein
MRIVLFAGAAALALFKQILPENSIMLARERAMAPARRHGVACV